MYLTNILTALGLCFLACNSLTIATPLYETESNEIVVRNPIQKRVSNLEFKQKKLRFGIEVETILKLDETSEAHKKFHEELEKAVSSLKKNLPKMELVRYMEPVFKKVREYMLEKWDRYQSDHFQAESEWLEDFKKQMNSGGELPPLPPMRDIYMDGKKDYNFWSITRDGSIDYSDIRSCKDIQL